MVCKYVYGVLVVTLPRDALSVTARRLYLAIDTYQQSHLRITFGGLKLYKSR